MKIIGHCRREGSWDYTECGRTTNHACAYKRDVFDDLAAKRFRKHHPQCKQCARKVKSRTS